MTNKQKSALAYLVMEGAVNELARAYEDGVPDGLGDVSYQEAITQVARWMSRLPGDIWHLGLPQVGKGLTTDH